MRKQPSIFKILCATLFMALVVWVNLNKGLYLHTHQKADGTKVVHAHPHAKTDAEGNTKKHQHSTEEETFIDSLSSDWDSLNDFVFGAEIPLSDFAYNLFSNHQHKGVSINLSYLRGPPSKA